jgi:hypothetical protein
MNEINDVLIDEEPPDPCEDCSSKDHRGNCTDHLCGIYQQKYYDWRVNQIETQYEEAY